MCVCVCLCVCVSVCVCVLGVGDGGGRVSSGQGSLPAGHKRSPVLTFRPFFARAHSCVSNSPANCFEVRLGVFKVRSPDLLMTGDNTKSGLNYSPPPHPPRPPHHHHPPLYTAIPTQLLPPSRFLSIEVWHHHATTTFQRTTSQLAIASSSFFLLFFFFLFFFLFFALPLESRDVTSCEADGKV